MSSPQGISLSSLIPAELSEPGGQFIPCPKTLKWLQETFLTPDSPFYNVEHDHLNSANLGVLWTNVPNERHMRRIVATAELAKPPTSLGKWAKARHEQQVEEWFHPPTAGLDFIITLYAPYFAGAAPIEQLATCDHELYHCGQKKDIFGLPLFSKKSGRPILGLRGHDVEEFVGIYRRYGYQAGAGESIALVETARGKPEISPARISGMCGTCR